MRLFIAINFAPALKNTLAGLVAELRQLPAAVKWVPPANIHLTLKFLGEVDAARAGEIGVALQHAAAGIDPWWLEVRGAGVFPGWRNPRVIWAGVEAAAPLYNLQRRLSEELRSLGFAADSFTPHVTLGRLRPGGVAGALKPRLEGLAGVSWGRERVTAVDLMESRLTPGGAVYRPVLTVSLPTSHISDPKEEKYT
jgi:2'-5' RNA ligase